MTIVYDDGGDDDYPDDSVRNDITGVDDKVMIVKS